MEPQIKAKQKKYFTCNYIINELNVSNHGVLGDNENVFCVSFYTILNTIKML